MCAAEREPPVGPAVRQLQDLADDALAARQRRRARVQRVRPLRQTARGTRTLLYSTRLAHSVTHICTVRVQSVRAHIH